MRDAFGGVFMIRLLLVFIVVYVMFAAISLNYAKAFRIKNKVITYIEQQEIEDMERIFEEGDSTTLDGLGEILSSLHYNLECQHGEGIQAREDPLDPARYCYHGIMIEEKSPEQQRTNEENHVIRYVVSSFVELDLSFMNNLLDITGRSPESYPVYNGIWKISGEAKVVKRIDPEENTNNDTIDYNEDRDINAVEGEEESKIHFQNEDYEPTTRQSTTTTTTKRATTTTRQTSTTRTTTTKRPTTTTRKIEEFIFQVPIDEMMSERELERFCRRQGKEIVNYRMLIREELRIYRIYCQ